MLTSPFTDPRIAVYVWRVVGPTVLIVTGSLLALTLLDLLHTLWPADQFLV